MHASDSMYMLGTVRTDPTMTAKDVLRVLKAQGWQALRQKGSHLQMVHLATERHATIPTHKGDLKIGTLKSIERQTGVRLK